MTLGRVNFPPPAGQIPPLAGRTTQDVGPGATPLAGRTPTGALPKPRGKLGGTNKFANFFVVEIPVVFRRQFFLDRKLYLQNHPPKARRETKAERATRYQRLMEENGWTRAELARQLGVSRAWVTKVLRS